MSESIHQRRCPYCAEEIRVEALLCKHCGKNPNDDPRNRMTPTQSVIGALICIAALGIGGIALWDATTESSCDKARAHGEALQSAGTTGLETGEDFRRSADELRAAADGIERVCY